MYKIAFALIVLMLFASCHSAGIGMDVGKDVSSSESEEWAMEELSIKWLGALSPTYYEKEVVVDAGRQISVNINRYENWDTVGDSCSGSAELTEDDYQTIKDHVVAADLLNYEPPMDGDEDCVVIVGGKGIEVSYSVAGGDSVAFATGPCQLESAIDNVAIVVKGFANTYVTDCTEELIAAPAEETEEAEEAEETGGTEEAGEVGEAPEAGEVP